MAAVREAVAESESGGEVLRLTDLDKRYPGVHALKGVSFSVRRGEVHAVVGENGAGKSTLVGIAAGAVVADSGTVEIDGATTAQPTPDWSRRQGLAIVHQEPALLPDLTVAENMRLGVGEQHRPHASNQKAWAAEHLRPWREAARIDPGTYVRDLRPDERFVVEIARALAGEPAVLILDEPTEHLLPEGVAVLFAGIKREIERGGAVVYISHRIREVMQVADRISVLRDGACRAELTASGVGEGEIVDLIVGRRLDARFPAKPDPSTFGATVLEVGGLSGIRFADVSLSARAGEVVGLAGIDGHGQRETMRALAGLAPSSGEVRVAGRKARLRSPATASASGFAYLPNDRHVEGILPQLDVRENLSIRSLSRFSRAGIVNRAAERRAAWEAIEEYEIKTPSLETDVEHLSGGNQQKTMLSRIMMSAAPVVLADEPTQGVDVGARADIYHSLRDAAAEGACVLVVSSDASELEGLCDRVLVFSGGRVVDELSGEAVSERNITQAALGAGGKHRREEGGKPAWWNPLLRLAQKDIAPALVLALVIVALGFVATSHSAAYLTTRNFTLVLPLFATLAFFAIGQQVVMFLGGIDLSIGPLAGLILVVASFRLSSDAEIVSGLVTILAVALAVGAVNWGMIVWLKISPLIATLVTYTGLQGIGLLIREEPGGSFAPGLLEAVTAKIDFIPVSVFVVVAIAVALEVFLYRSLIGIKLRGVGSSPRTAERVGVRSNRVMLLAYLGSACFALLGALLLMPQVGSGNATAGNSYTLLSVAAVVLGGASIFGGRGSFVGALLGAALIVQINTVVQFLGLTAYWQEYLLGGLTILAAAFYSKARAVTTRAVASEHGAAEA
ncbi:MAG TPA: ATP-binding cassette domain-containing protein [Solirubrobacterales bacterium]